MKTETQTPTTETIDQYCRAIHMMLKNREIHPRGSFDKAGRWYALNNCLLNVRSPSREYPYSQMQACRTLKYVRAVAKEFDCQSFNDILSNI